jgi:hypothetical protein
MFSQKITTKCFLTQMCWIGIGGLYQDTTRSKHVFGNNSVIMPSEKDSEGDNNKE